jgi:hypothetical protein
MKLNFLGSFSLVAVLAATLLVGVNSAVAQTTHGAAASTAEALSNGRACAGACPEPTTTNAPICSTGQIDLSIGIVLSGVSSQYNGCFDPKDQSSIEKLKKVQPMLLEILKQQKLLLEIILEN